MKFLISYLLYIYAKQHIQGIAILKVRWLDNAN